MIKSRPLHKIPLGGNQCRPHRLGAQDATLSRSKPGFESPWGHKKSHRLMALLFCIMKLPNKDLFFARAYYFTLIGGVGFVSPFINLFYVSLGISGKQIGLIS